MREGQGQADEHPYSDACPARPSHGRPNRHLPSAPRCVLRGASSFRDSAPLQFTPTPGRGLETNVHPAIWITRHPHPYQDRVFADLQPDLSRLVHDLVTVAADHRRRNVHDLASKIDKLAIRLASCVTLPIVYGQDDPDRPFLVEARCKSRLCPRCSRFRANKLLADLRYYVTLIDSPRFLTLTLKSSDDPLRAQLLHLRKSFAKLRRSKIWRAHVKGGLYTVEVTYNRKSGQWHPHLHAIIDGKYFRQSAIVEAWKIASGGSFIVDIRACHSRDDAVNYLATYIGKSSDARNFPQRQVAEWALNVHGLRFVARFGTLHKAVLPAAELRESISGINIICAADHLAAAAIEGDGEAEEILRVFAGRPLRRVPDGEPEAPVVDEAGDGTLTQRVRAWWRLREELLREQHQRAERPWEFVDSYHRAIRIRKKRAPPHRPEVLPFRDGRHKV